MRRSALITAQRRSSASSLARSSYASSLSSLAAVVRSSRSTRAISRDDFRPAAPEAAFPAFGSAVMPISRVPNWGVMETPAEWTRSHEQMSADDFVSLPPYDLSELTIPMDTLSPERTPEHVRLITAKLAYSTRYFGRYDLDSGEFEGAHAGIDIKLALDTPVAAIGGGRVSTVGSDDLLGTYVIIEHHLDDGTYFSIYGHLGIVSVAPGDDVAAGQTIGKVGLTGESASPHVHLQIDRDDGVRPHLPYRAGLPITNPADAIWTVNPILFIQRHTAL